MNPGTSCRSFKCCLWYEPLRAGKGLYNLRVLRGFVCKSSPVPVSASHKVKKDLPFRSTAEHTKGQRKTGRHMCTRPQASYDDGDQARQNLEGRSRGSNSLTTMGRESSLSALGRCASRGCMAEHPRAHSGLVRPAGLAPSNLLQIITIN